MLKKISKKVDFYPILTRKGGILTPIFGFGGQNPKITPKMDSVTQKT
jgi:hypothetical protein